MKWRGRRTSDNIADVRRGGARGGAMRAGGIGGVGVILVLLAGLFFGVDLTPLLQGGGTPAPEARQAGGNVIGRYNGLFGEKDVTGEVKNNNLHLWFNVEYQGSMHPLNYHGEILSDDTMKGTATFGNTIKVDWTAKKE